MTVAEDSNSRPKLNRSKQKKRTCISKIAPGCKREFVSLHPGIRMCSKGRDTARQFYERDSQSLNIRR